MRVQNVALAEVVDEVVELFGAARPEGVHLDLAVAPGLAVCADPGQLRQVLWNLVRNAAEAMPEGGRLQIRAGESDCPPQDEPSGLRNGRTEESQWAEISVVDEGVGIPPDALGKIFAPFYTTKPDGSGLGLATVHRIVEEHGGSVRLESRVGSGTTVWLRLPKASR
jgi:signal transduction histidine kinase